MSNALAEEYAKALQDAEKAALLAEKARATARNSWFNGTRKEEKKPYTHVTSGNGKTLVYIS